MCVVSMVIDHSRDKWQEKDWINLPRWPVTTPGVPMPSLPPQPSLLNPLLTKQEFDEFKKDFEDFKKLVLRALKYDEMNNEPHCEMDFKAELVRRVAQELGVSIDDLKFTSE